jgi:hypothetical protein
MRDGIDESNNHATCNHPSKGEMRKLFIAEMEAERVDQCANENCDCAEGNAALNIAIAIMKRGIL